MTEQEERIALCERLLGWKRHGATWGWQNAGTNTISAQLPDTNSLDVLHEMRRKLSHEQSVEWTGVLCKLVGGDRMPWPYEVFDATSAQRREALCRVLFPERFK